MRHTKKKAVISLKDELPIDDFTVENLVNDAEQLIYVHNLCCVAKNLSWGFLTRSDTNRAVQPQKINRGLKLREVEDGTIYVAKT